MPSTLFQYHGLIPITIDEEKVKDEKPVEGQLNILSLLKPHISYRMQLVSSKVKRFVKFTWIDKVFVIEVNAFYAQ